MRAWCAFRCGFRHSAGSKARVRLRYPPGVRPDLWFGRAALVDGVKFWLWGHVEDGRANFVDVGADDDEVVVGVGRGRQPNAGTIHRVALRATVEPEASEARVVQSDEDAIRDELATPPIGRARAFSRGGV